MPLRGFHGSRKCLHGYLYLLEENDFSARHRIRQDDILHFYPEGALRLVMISLDGEISEVLARQHVAAGEYVQYAVPAGYGFVARLVAGAAFSFIG